jgi:hypothetical protein
MKGKQSTENEKFVASLLYFLARNFIARRLNSGNRPAHARRMYGANRHVAAFTGPVGAALARHCQRHFATENDVRGFCGVRVIGIRHVRRIFPDVRPTESFLLKSSCEFVHWMILANTGHSDR